MIRNEPEPTDFNHLEDVTQAVKKYFKKGFKDKKTSVKTVFKIASWLFLVGVLAGIITFASFLIDLPRPEKFAEGVIDQSTKIYDRTGEVLLYEIAGAQKRTFVPLDEIPEILQKTVISSEDRNFYTHYGIDLRGIARSILYDLKLGAKPAQGGSTISQQLIRSYFLTLNKTLERKTREIVLAIELERRYSKDQILEWYLNIIPFGSNLYGVEAASMAFFGKHVGDITLAQAATLTGILRATTYYSPYGSHVDELMAVKDRIIDSTLEEGYITQEQADTAKAEKIVFADNATILKAPHFVMYVKSYLEEKYGESYVEKSGLKVITTLDMDLQSYGQKLVEERVDSYSVYNAFNGALASINPKTGEILAMIGSKDYFADSYPEGCTPGVNCKFDPEVNVTLANRQPGSAFKPFAYSVAFEKGFRPESLIWDVVTEFNPRCASSAIDAQDQYGLDCYHPKNYDGKFEGLLTLREALAQSRNLPAVKILYLAGIGDTINLARSMGITTLKDEKNYGLALVLGGGEVKPLEMASAYGIFANDGLKAPLHFIKEITDSSGKVVEEEKTGAVRVLQAEIARLISDVLSDNAARAPLFGWNSVLFLPGYDSAVKTGTTQNNKDAWAIGYTTNIVAAVWVGNSDSSVTQKEGSSLAGPIWHDFMLYALPGLEQENFQAPDLTTPDKPMLDGTAPEEPHSLLYYINKNNPLGGGNSQNDEQFDNWEAGVQNWLQENNP